MSDLYSKLQQSAEFIKSKTAIVPEIGIVLGSGLGDLAAQIEDVTVIPYKTIPNFPVSTVAGHAGNLLIGRLCGKSVVCMQGRFHFYEGYDMPTLVFPIQVMKFIGVKTLILTNAAGCVNKNWGPGELMLISDQIKLCAESPLRGANDERIGDRFFDMTDIYTPEYRALAKDVALKLGITLREGVYQYFTGPNYETPAEVRFARYAGADAVGMSTVPEAIAARHCGLKIIGISCMTNMAAGVSDTPLVHEEVLETSRRVTGDFQNLVKGIVARL